MNDRLIDEVAQEMTSAPSDGRLAQRVSARLAETPHPWMTATLKGSLYAAVAAACVLAVAVFVVREKPIAPQPITGADIAIASSLEPRVPSPEYRVPSAEYRVPSPEPRAIAPIDVAPIEVPRLVETNVIQITPIAIDRIEIPEMP